MKEGQGIVESLAARGRQRRDEAGRVGGGRKKSEAVEGKKEDSRRFNTR